MKRYFQLYDVASDYSLSPVDEKYQFGDLKHAKERAQKITFKWYDKMHREGKSHFPKGNYKIKWRRGTSAGIRPESIMEWNGTIHDFELVYKIIERKENPILSSTMRISSKGKFTKTHLATLRREYAKINKIDPELPSYGNLIAALDNLTQPQLKQLASAKIKWVSSLARNRIERKENPKRKKTMRKKKRSAKQLANDKRLGRMAKARAKAKRGIGRKRKLKVGRTRLTVKQANPHSRFQKKLASKARTVSARSHLWNIFKCYGKSVRFLGLTTAGKLQWTIRDAAIIWKSKERAAKIAKKVSTKRGMSNYDIGVSSREMSAAQIATGCKAGK